MSTLQWTKSSRCDTTCVEVAFRRSTRCSSGNCVEVGFAKSSRSFDGACVEVGACRCDNGAGLVYVRDSKNPSGPVLSFDASTWRDFLDAVKADALA